MIFTVHHGGGGGGGNCVPFKVQALEFTFGLPLLPCCTWSSDLKTSTWAFFHDACLYIEGSAHKWAEPFAFISSFVFTLKNIDLSAN